MKRKVVERLPPAMLQRLEPRVLLSAPQAMLEADDITTGGALAYTFAVHYESDQPLDLNSLGGDDILVTGPNGYARSARLMGVIATENPLAASAIYRIEAPGNSWDAADDGTYDIDLVAGEVANTAAEVNAAAALGSINVAVAGSGVIDDSPRQLGELTELTLLTNLNTVSIPVRRFEFQMTGTGTKDNFIQLDYAAKESKPTIRLYRRLNGTYVNVGSLKQNKRTYNTQDARSRRISLKKLPAGTYVIEVDSRGATNDRSQQPYITPDDYEQYTISRRNPQFSLAVNPAVAPTPDLLAAAIATPNVPTTLIPGDAIRTRVTMTNIGAGRIKGSVNVELYLSADQTLDAGDALVGTNATELTRDEDGFTEVKIEANNISLKPDKSRTVTVTGKAPSNLAAGAYYLLARVHTGGLIPEVSEANNVIATAAPFDFTYGFGTFDDRVNAVMRFFESDGTEVSLKLNGGGFGQLTFNAGVPSILLRSTTTASQLNVTTRFGSNTWRIDDLTVGDGGDPPTSIGSVIATTTTLLGAATATGTLGSAVFANVTLP